MKLKINYKTDNEGWKIAFTEIGDFIYAGVDKDSFETAKHKLIERIKEAQRIMPPVIPEPEEVEV